MALLNNHINSEKIDLSNTGFIQGTGVSYVVALSTAEYEAIENKNAYTLYVVID